MTNNYIAFADNGRVNRVQRALITNIVETMTTEQVPGDDSTKKTVYKVELYVVGKETPITFETTDEKQYQLFLIDLLEITEEELKEAEAKAKADAE